MEIQGVNTKPDQDPAKKAPHGQITRDDFLKLLITQLQNQDPMKPLDNQEFAMQLATYNSLEQLIGINEKLDSLSSKQLLASQFNTASLIGKEISTNGNLIALKEDADASIRYRLSGNASRVVVNIKDGRGELVQQMEVGSQQTGDQVVRWDGRDKSGTKLPAGLYTFEINAFDAAGKTVPASGRIQGVVTGVSLEGSEPVLELGQLKVPLSKVTAIR